MSSATKPMLKIATDHNLDYRMPERQSEPSKIDDGENEPVIDLQTPEVTADPVQPVKVYNNVSAGRRAKGYQKQFAKALQLLRAGEIQPNNRQICDAVNCGNKVAGRILVDLCQSYPSEFERTATGRVKFASSLAA